MKARKQGDFFAGSREHGPERKEHGGEEGKGLRKLDRPLDHRRPIHLILKSSHATGRLSMLGFKNKVVIEKILEDRARQFGIKLHAKQNVGNHIHILASFPKRTAFQDFLRTVTALIARHVTGARRGKPFGQRFWDHLAYTRVIFGYRDFNGMLNYILKNKMQAEAGSHVRKAYEEFEAEVRRAKKSGESFCLIFETG